MKLSKEQKTAIDGIIATLRSCRYGDRRWQFRDGFVLTIGGYAGTGKTTLLCEARKKIFKLFPHLNVAFVSFTGKASSVLKTKLENSKITYSQDSVGTIHSLIYVAETQYDQQLKTHVVIGWKLKDVDDLFADLIIIDEASMISKQIWNDLLKFGKGIIAVGDHGQLPPIGDQFSLLKDTDFQLTEIHRQALDSPIIYLSKLIREEGHIPVDGFFSKEVFRLNWGSDRCKHIWNNKVVFDEGLMVLCGFNTTRCELNDIIRKKLNYDKKIIPYPGERIVCLVNNHTTKIMNGQIGTLLWIMPDKHRLYRMTIDMGRDEPVECMVSLKCFGEVTYTMYDQSKQYIQQRNYTNEKISSGVDFFDYGYAMSVHKSQGSEWDRVIVFEQRSRHWDDSMYARWLYTAVTRATKKLFVITNYF